MTFPYELTTSQVLQEILYLSDEKLQMLLDCLNQGFENEWDCKLEYAVKAFACGEWKPAIKSAINLAKDIENKNE